MSDKNRSRGNVKTLFLIVGYVLLFIVVAYVVFNLARFMNAGDSDNTSYTTTPTVEQSIGVEKKPDEPKQPIVATKQELLDEVNKRRAEVGAVALQHSVVLEQSAQEKCDDMVARNYYAHADPDGRQGYNIAINKIGDTRGNYAENLLMRDSRLDSPAYSIFSAWFESQTHKDAAIDSKYQITGFGVCKRGTDNFFVQHFYGQ